MNTIMKVKGMRCDACEKIIRMEIEEHEVLKSKLVRIEVLDPDKEVGEVEMRALSSEEKIFIIDMINSIGDYKAIN